jgi:prepilin peptidase CpaA
MITSAVLVAFPLLVIYAAVSDLLTMTIPNGVSLLLVPGFLVCALLVGWSPEQILMHASSGLAVLAAGFILFGLGWIGGGDAKLAAATALWLGFGSLLEYTLLAAVYGGGLTLAIVILRSFPLPAFALGWGWLGRLHDKKSGVPYGIALAAAALVIYPTSALWRAGV